MNKTQTASTASTDRMRVVHVLGVLSELSDRGAGVCEYVTAMEYVTDTERSIVKAILRADRDIPRDDTKRVFDVVRVSDRVHHVESPDRWCQVLDMLYAVSNGSTNDGTVFSQTHVRNVVANQPVHVQQFIYRMNETLLSADTHALIETELRY